MKRKIPRDTQCNNKTLPEICQEIAFHFNKYFATITPIQKAGITTKPIIPLIVLFSLAFISQE